MIVTKSLRILVSFALALASGNLEAPLQARFRTWFREPVASDREGGP